MPLYVTAAHDIFVGALLLLTYGSVSLVAVQGGLQIVGALLPKRPPRRSARPRTGFVSIHVPTCNEPPVLLKNTLRSLHGLRHGDFEVIVLDNNTADPAVWRPIQAYCKELGAPFRFYHVDKLSGFKAGALNLLREKTDPRAEFIAVVDADYEVQPDFLTEALRYFSDERVAFVQFPQTYQNIGSGNRGLRIEYEHFFQNYLNAGNRFGCVTATGTLTVFRAAVLRHVGPYTPTSMTEDAEMGARLFFAGYRGVFVDRVMGRGVMPYDFVAYKKQKKRWARGNMEVLMRRFTDIVFPSDLSWAQKLALLSQLGAWTNFTLLPSLCIVAFSLAEMAGIGEGRFTERIILVSAAALAIHVATKTVAFGLLFHGRYSWTDILRALAVHFGMNWTYATALFLGVFRLGGKFERTNKFIIPRVPPAVEHSIFEIGMSIVSAVLGMIAVAEGRPAIAAAAVLVFALHASVVMVDAETRFTKRVSAMLLKELETRTRL